MKNVFQMQKTYKTHKSYHVFLVKKEKTLYDGLYDRIIQNHLKKKKNIRPHF
jgi:hypothetical protein